MIIVAMFRRVFWKQKLRLV